MSRVTGSTVEVAVATLNQHEPARLRERLGLGHTDAQLLIINQVGSARGAEREPAPGHPSLEPQRGDGWRMLSFAEVGLSRSRNRALDAAQGDILLLADDDVRYVDGFEALVREAFARHRDAAAITFQFIEEATRTPSKRYRRNVARHGRWSIAGISSIEVALRPLLLRGARFDERFGLGTAHPTGEEALFLAELLRRGAQAWYQPAALCSHRGVSSGHGRWSPELTRAKAAVIRRLFPSTWPIVLAGFALSKYPRFGAAHGACRWLSELHAGATEAPR